MKRKVIKQGNNTLTITLPRKWVSKFEVGAGDEINLEESDKSLIISSDKMKGLSETNISFEGLNQPLLWRIIYGVYRVGYDSIHITFDPEKKYKNVYTNLANSKEKITMNSIEVIQDALSCLSGMVIIEQGKDYCLIKDLGGTTDREFDNALRRIFFIIEEMGSDCLCLFKEKKDSIVKGIDINDISADKFSDYCLRVLNKKWYKNFKKTSIIYSIILLLEFIADEYKRVSYHLLKLRNNSKELFLIFEEVNKFFQNFHKFFYNFDKENMLKLYDENEKLMKQFRNFNFKKGEEEIIHHLKKIRRFIIDLKQLKIDLEA